MYVRVTILIVKSCNNKNDTLKVKVNFSKETFSNTYSHWPLKPVFLPTPLYIEDASLTAM
jgi:hypothetical protein